MWYDGGSLKPRWTIMPRPAPARPWQGEQKMWKRSRPRSTSVRVNGTGSAATNFPSRPMPVSKTRSAPSSSRATVPSTGGRAPEPSWKKSLPARGFTFGWLNMSWRQAAAEAARIAIAHAAARRASARRPSRLDIEHSARMEPRQERPRRRLVELRVLRLDAQEVAIAARQGEALDVEHRMVRGRQAVQRQHPEHREDPGDQDGHLE